MKAVEVVRKCEHLPKLCVIDLDKTVWDVFAAENTQPPYRQRGDSSVVDANGRSIRIHVDTRDILEALRDAGCIIGVASLSGDFERCNQLLGALGLKRFLRKDLMQIHSGRGKESHFKALQLASCVSFRDMLFFDDLPANLNAARKLGMTATLVKDGLSCKVLAQGLQEYAARRRSSSLMSNWLGKAAPAPQRRTPTPPASSKVDSAERGPSLQVAPPAHSAEEEETAASSNSAPAQCANTEREGTGGGGAETQRVGAECEAESSRGASEGSLRCVGVRKRPEGGEQQEESGRDGGGSAAKRARSGRGAAGEGAGGRAGAGREALSLSALQYTPR